MKNHTKMVFILVVLCLSMNAFAASVTITNMAATIAKGLCNFKTLVIGVLPALALILFLFAGLAYAAGQAFGAEVKSKAQGWAMTLVVGGIIGIVLAALAPILVQIFIAMAAGTGMKPVSCP